LAVVKAPDVRPLAAPRDAAASDPGSDSAASYQEAAQTLKAMGRKSD